jgi:hypothetical protein
MRKSKVDNFGPGCKYYRDFLPGLFSLFPFYAISKINPFFNLSIFTRNKKRMTKTDHPFEPI